MKKRVNSLITGREIKILVIAIAVCAIILLLDIVTPIGYIHWLLYVIPLIIAYRTENSFFTYSILFVIAVSIIIGLVTPPPGPFNGNIYIIDIINRVTGFIVLFIFTIVINHLIQVGKKYQRLSRELEDTNKELESFAYSLSHDLRTPLNVTKGFIALLKEEYSGTLDQAGINYLSLISSNADKMNILIDDMLKIARMSSREIVLQEINLSAMASSIIKDLRSLEPERLVEVIIQKDLKAKADSHLVNIALSNLLGNAWKYTRKTANARIEFGITEKNSEQVFFIRDNGAGFDMNKIEHLFEPFHRLHSEKEFSGTGIGLPIVQRVIDRHGGKIWGEGEVGKGATFYFTLPLN